MQGRSSWRAGVFTPVVIMVLVVFAILGITYSFTGSASYGQSAQVIYALKAQMLAQAALEEAQTVVYDKVNRPTVVTPGQAPQVAEWKADLLAKIGDEMKSKDRKDDNSGTGPIRFRGADDKGWINLLGAGLVEKIKTLATDLGGEAEIGECKVKFYGFHKIGYNATGDVYDKEKYYRNDILDKDVPEWVPNDWIGYYTIRVAARSNKQTRTFAVTHDMKVVNVAPMGHEFAFFQMGDVSKENASYQDGDLNKGGAFRVFPRGWGRAFMRGPYSVEAEGLPNGNGGYGPQQDDQHPKMPVSNFFLATLNQQDQLEWKGWHLIPTPRAGVPKRAWVISARPQVRPKEQSSAILGTIIGEVVNNVPVISSLGSGTTALGVDPGLFISENQMWYTGVKDHTNKEFSLVGEPRGDYTKSSGFCAFRGEKFKLGSDSKKANSSAYWPAEDLETPGGGSNQLRYAGMYLASPPQDSINDNWYIAPEAQLKLKVHLVRFKHPGINWTDLFRLHNPFNFTYNIALEDTSSSPNGVATNMYALHWEPERVRGVLDSILDTVRSIAPIAFFANPALLIFNMDPRSFASGSVPGGPDDFKDVAKRSLPSNYKGVWSRAATRMYAKAGKIRSFVEAGKSGGTGRLLLDGVLWANELKVEVPFQYVGKGILGADPPAGTGTPQEALITGPVAPVRPRVEEAQAKGDAGANGSWEDENKRWKTENFISVIYNGFRENQVSASQMLLLKLKSGGSTPQVFDGSFYSTHGVKPDSGQTASIYGNLVVGVVNKEKIPGDAILQVDYDQKALSRRSPKAEGPDVAVKYFTSPEWQDCSVSPKVSGYFER